MRAIAADEDELKLGMSRDHLIVILDQLRSELATRPTPMRRVIHCDVFLSLKFATITTADTSPVTTDQLVLQRIENRSLVRRGCICGTRVVLPFLGLGQRVVLAVFFDLCGTARCGLQL